MRLCKDEEVRRNCPLTCGICCDDDSSYTFMTYFHIEKSCFWITKKEKRKSKYCCQYRNGKVARAACPKAWDYCKAPITDEWRYILIMCTSSWLSFKIILEYYAIEFGVPYVYTATAKKKKFFVRHEDLSVWSKRHHSSFSFLAHAFRSHRYHHFPKSFTVLHVVTTRCCHPRPWRHW